MKKKIKKIKNNLRVSNYSGYRVCYNGSIKIERYKTSQTENKGCDQNRYCRKGKKGNVMFKMFALDFENETIVCSKKALRAASNPTTAEYKALMKMKKLQPTFKVVAREIETNENKNSYKGLTLNLIQSYIETTNTKETLMAEFNEHKTNGGYPLVKKWWCENFKHITVVQMKSAIDKKNREGIKTKVKLTVISNNTTEQKKAVGQNQN